MNTQDFTTTILVDQSPEEAFNAIKNVRGWWTENLEGSSQNLNDEFTVRFWDVHVSTQKLVEVVEGKRVVWLVTNSSLNFIDDKQEWTKTRISFEITKKDNQTEIKFTHFGLGECYNACSNAWGDYINNSLRSLIITGAGKPTLREI